eukprot:CAMPEP_0206393610 /NCGR_PEP_ID=MMETSP0294-20121207/20832_1 /ASSEMBLY_ACC=CAM_ASM_000327 /TAXON_ID=39354 /ORGANISM="Heterosigma akashiwo, Strain CCMP2393" /LENGTH=237 /DNA_ID=CAMNT_0053847263 /DNA_START=47 /DNA_END=757 /DNA_ORIENTATION=+
MAEHTNTNAIESLLWLDGLIKHLWLLHREGDPPHGPQGGLGAYISELVAESLEEELYAMRASSDVTSLRLVECTLGKVAPTLRGGRLLNSWTDLDTRHTFVTLELDADWETEGMSIVFSFKLSSLEHAKLPFTSIQVSNLALTGRALVTLELLPDFPFVGLLTFSFTEMPDLAFGVRPLQGIDLSSIPGLGAWVAHSAERSLAYYVHPSFYGYDLEALLCPECLLEREGRAAAAAAA